MTEVTGEKHHVDHTVPLRCKEASGLHVPANFCIIPASFNVRKKNKLDERQLAGASLGNTILDLRSCGLLSFGSPAWLALREYANEVEEVLLSEFN